jgi:mannosyltransferase OCH1-like enzyme
MIPKVIHYVWLGPKPIPQLDRANIKGWKTLNPSFKIKRWSEKNFPIDRYPFILEAIKHKNYALASDAIRIYALMTEGGIYMDTDVELLKPLSPYLKYEAIGAYESKYWFGTAFLAAQKDSPWMIKLWQRYCGLPPKNFDKLTNIKTVHAASVIAHDTFCIKPNGTTRLKHKSIATFAPEYFFPIHYISGEGTPSSRTIAIHHYASSWHTMPQKIQITVIGFVRKVFGAKVYLVPEKLFCRYMAYLIHTEYKS